MTGSRQLMGNKGSKRFIFFVKMNSSCLTRLQMRKKPSSQPSSRSNHVRGLENLLNS